MGVFDFLFKKKEATGVQLVSEQGKTHIAFKGKLYDSDLIRSCIRPKAKAIGKLNAKHLLDTGDELKINPELHIHFLLEEPNLYMTGQMLQQKMTIHLMLQGNAFAFIHRDKHLNPIGIYPIDYQSAEKVYIQNQLHIKFRFINGQEYTFNYNDLIHLRNDFNDNDLFASSPFLSLMNLLEVIHHVDNSIISAIKNGNAIRWLLKFNSTLRPDDIKKQTEEFVKSFLASGSSGGAAGIDSKVDAIQVNPQNFVPNAEQFNATQKRVLQFFNTNEKIVQSNYTEDEWNAYYEAEIEPEVIQWSNEYTRKLFTREQRANGNRIVFESANLQCASISTKLGLVSLVDRGAMTTNEWRKIFSLPPIEGGDIPIRRLDTAVVEIEKGGGEDEESGN